MIYKNFKNVNFSSVTQPIRYPWLDMGGTSTSCIYSAVQGRTVYVEDDSRKIRA